MWYPSTPPSRLAVSVPIVIEPSERGDRAYDLFSLLLKERIVFITAAIDDGTASLAIAQLLYLAREDPQRDIHLYINSPGGVASAGLAIYDTMQTVQPDVATTCIGTAASAAAVILGGGARGKRFALPSARMLIHQPSGGLQGTASDIEVQVRQMLDLKERVERILAHDTGQPLERIRQDISRDFWMSAEEARDYGLIDAIIGVPGPAAANGREPR